MNQPYKSTTNRVLFGVCGAIAEHFQLDATRVRIAAVVLFVMGFELLACIYVAAGLLLPDGGSR